MNSFLNFDKYTVLELLNYNPINKIFLIKYDNSEVKGILKKKIIKKNLIKNLNQLINNLESIKNFNHINLIKLNHFKVKDKGKNYVIKLFYEYLENGLLIYYLANIKNFDINIDLYWIKQLFNGILYLIDKNPFYLYYNHLYLDKNYNLKIGNLGALNSLDLINYDLQDKYKNQKILLLIHQFVHLSIMILTKKDNLFNIRVDRDFALNLIKNNMIEKLKSIFKKEKNLKIVNPNILEVFINAHKLTDTKQIINEIKTLVNNIKDVNKTEYKNYFENFYNSQINEILSDSRISMHNNTSNSIITPKTRNNQFFNFLSINYKKINYDIKLLYKYQYLKTGSEKLYSDNIINYLLNKIDYNEEENEFSEFIIIQNNLKFNIQAVKDLENFYIIFKVIHGEYKDLVKFINYVKWI